MKKFLRRIELFIICFLSMTIGVDDFTCRDDWDVSKSIWTNLKKVVDEEMENRE